MQKISPEILYRYRKIVKISEIFRSLMTSITMLSPSQSLSNFVKIKSIMMLEDFNLGVNMVIDVFLVFSVEFFALCSDNKNNLFAKLPYSLSVKVTQPT